MNENFPRKTNKLAENHQTQKKIFLNWKENLEKVFQS